jgi:hypothetical protein
MKYLGLPLSVKCLKRIHFQHLEDRVAAKLVPWLGRNATMAGRLVLVKAVLSSIAIYYITVLHVPLEVLSKIDSIRRAFLWAASDKVSGGKCKVNWELVCKPKIYGGLGVLNLPKFASALRLRWLWNEWDETPKPWVGLGNPCTSKDHDLFAAATVVNIGNGEKALFWESAWLNGMRPKDWAPKLFDIARRRKCTVKKALENDLWVASINTRQGLTIEHIEEFYKLWGMIQHVHLSQDTPDIISWKLEKGGIYSAASAYKMQFLGHTFSMMPPMVWKPWAPPKCKIFAWLIIQNRVWTADRLERRGWPNCGRCKLCNQVQESAAHLLFKCRFARRIWESIKTWLGLGDFQPRHWVDIHNVEDWWGDVIHKKRQGTKALASLAMLVSWELWKERNARVFRNQFSTFNVVISRIKEEVALWGLAGAKTLCNIIPRE